MNQTLTMTRVSKVVVQRLAAAPEILGLRGRNRRRLATDLLLTEALDRAGVPADCALLKVERMNARRLAEALSRPPIFIKAMRAAGYRFKHEPATTTLDHAQQWLAAHPDFLLMLDAPVQGKMAQSPAPQPGSTALERSNH